MSLQVLDKKYKEAIPPIIASLPVEILADDDVEAICLDYRKKVRKSKPRKLGKSGLFPGEEADIVQWWLQRGNRPSASETQESTTDTTNTCLVELSLIILKKWCEIRSPKQANPGSLKILMSYSIYSSIDSAFGTR